MVTAGILGLGCHDLGGESSSSSSLFGTVDGADLVHESGNWVFVIRCPLAATGSFFAAGW